MYTGIPHSSLGFARANGIEIAYDTFGSRTDRPLVLIMGLSAQMILWEDAFCTLLAGKGFHVIRFDNRDVGMSTKMSAFGMPHIQALLTGGQVPVPYTLIDMAKDTIGLLDALAIDQAHVVGASMGGMIAQEMAIGFPERILTLTSIMSSTGSSAVPLPSSEAIEILFRPIPVQKEPFIAYFRDVWRFLGGPQYPMDYATAVRLGEETFRRGVEPAGNARQLAAIFASGSRKKRLASVNCPTLVLHGSVDPLVPLEGGQDTAASIPGARLQVFDTMGHFMHPALWRDIIEAIGRHADLQ